MRSILDGFMWALVAMHGATQPKFKLDCLVGLVWVCGDERLAILVGGDLSIVRWRKEKNNDNFNGLCLFMFNANIEILDLREPGLIGGNTHGWTI